MFLEDYVILFIANKDSLVLAIGCGDDIKKNITDLYKVFFYCK